jgi:putative membrane protein
MRVLHVATWICLAASVGCSDEVGIDPRHTTAGTGSEASAWEPLSDGQIVHALVTMNEREVRHAGIALERASNPEVRDFASKMKEHHASSRDEVLELAESDGVVPERSVVTDVVEDENTEELGILHAVEDHLFDFAYVQVEIAVHESVLTTLEEQLAPQADGKSLRHFLAGSREAAESHLVDAQVLADSL